VVENVNGKGNEARWKSPGKVMLWSLGSILTVSGMRRVIGWPSIFKKIPLALLGRMGWREENE
jgi:hypothetical protein